MNYYKQSFSSNKMNDDDQMNLEEENQTGGQGFAGMPPQKQRNIASKGGRMAHKKGTAHGR